MTRVRIRMTGVVQGVGFRPHVARLAALRQMIGLIRNETGCVTLELQDTPTAIDGFLEEVLQTLPALASVDRIDKQVLPLEQHASGFHILASEPSWSSVTPVPADIAPCDQCLAELFDPLNRRYRYPFINCTNCGPRFTIIEHLPYDRANTTMRLFDMCAACRSEYENPLDRRYHAQPNACPVCGPQVWFVPNAANFDSHRLSTDVSSIKGESAIAAFHASVAQGKIVAVKGLGGFHLACDATSSVAVERLRQRKQRPDKPLAVMLATLDECRRWAKVSSDEARLLTSAQRPIVLLDRLAASEQSAYAVLAEKHCSPQSTNWRDATLLAAASPVAAERSTVGDDQWQSGRRAHRSR